MSLCGYKIFWSRRFVPKTPMMLYSDNKSTNYIVQTLCFMRGQNILKHIVMWYEENMMLVLLSQSMCLLPISLWVCWLSYLGDLGCSSFVTSWACMMYMLQHEGECYVINIYKKDFYVKVLIYYINKRRWDGINTSI